MEPPPPLSRSRGVTRDEAVRYPISSALFFAMICGLLVLTANSPAAAKGPVQAVIQGPGISPISLRPSGEASIGETLATMVQESGFFAGLHGADAPWRHQRPDGNLGPRYVVTYRLGGRDGSRSIIQYVYPYASAGPVTYMPPGQRSWTDQETTGGWHRADASFKEMLITAGFPKEQPDTAVKATNDRQATPTPVQLLMAFVALAGAAVFLRRTRSLHFLKLLTLRPKAALRPRTQPTQEDRLRSVPTRRIQG
jgi:hypothetical protein